MYGTQKEKYVPFVQNISFFSKKKFHHRIVVSGNYKLFSRSQFSTTINLNEKLSIFYYYCC